MFDIVAPPPRSNASLVARQLDGRRVGPQQYAQGVTFDQSESEIQAHIDGPVQTAWEWLVAAIGAPDHETLWALTDPAWKNVRARAWLSGQAEGASDEAEIAEIAAQLVNGVAPQSLGSRFAASELDYYAQLFGHFDLDQMGAASRPRVVAPDYEIVVLAQLGTQTVHAMPPVLAAQALDFSPAHAERHD